MMDVSQYCANCESQAAEIARLTAALEISQGQAKALGEGYDGLKAEHERLAGEVERLRSTVVAFCGPWADLYAESHGLPNGHLHSTHYDILAECGARMDDFVRHDPAALAAKDQPHG